MNRKKSTESDAFFFSLYTKSWNTQRLTWRRIFWNHVFFSVDRMIERERQEEIKIHAICLFINNTNLLSRNGPIFVVSTKHKTLVSCFMAVGSVPNLILICASYVCVLSLLVLQSAYMMTCISHIICTKTFRMSNMSFIRFYARILCHIFFHLSEWMESNEQNETVTLR